MANRFNVNEAYPGFCTLCHDEIAEFDGFIRFGKVMRPKVIFLKPNFRQAMIELSDKTFMTITLCDKCYDFEPKDCAKIYESEVRGWEREINDIDWKPESKPQMEAWYKKQKSIQVVNRIDKVWSSDEKKKITKHRLGEK